MNSNFNVLKETYTDLSSICVSFQSNPILMNVLGLQCYNPDTKILKLLEKNLK